MALIFHLWDKLWATVFPPHWTDKPAIHFHHKDYRPGGGA